jgi:hypothetical protein
VKTLIILSKVLVIKYLVLISYYNNLNNFFVSEDLVQVWDTDFYFLLRQLFPNRVTGYRPVMFAWWWLGYALYGYTPFAFRWIILLLHIVNSIILLVIVESVTRSSISGLISSIIYLPMVVHSDAINWISAASNQITCGFFFLCTVYIYIRYKKAYYRSKRLLIICIVTMILAMSTNETALITPIALLGIDIVTKNKSSGKLLEVFRWRRLGFILLAWVIFMVWRALAVHGVGGYGASVHLRVGGFLLQTGEAIARMLLLPWSQSIVISDLLSNIFNNLITLIFVLLALCAILWPGRVGIVVMFVSLLPVLNIPAYHRLYIPAAGFAIAIGITLGAVFHFPRKWLRVGLSAIVLLVLVFNFIQQYHALLSRNQDWSKASRITLTVVRQTVSLIPAPPGNSIFYYYGLPKNLGNGVQVFNWGLRQALQAAYNDRSLKGFRVKKIVDTPYNLERSLDQVLQQKDFDKTIYLLIFDINKMELRLSSEEEFIHVVSTSKLGPEY